jgi:hypothetical protein
MKKNKNNPRFMAFLIKKAWINVIIFLGAFLMIGLGVYFYSQPEWIQRSDIKLYNQGILTYRLPPELLPDSDGHPAEYPVVRAAEYFNEAALESTDNDIKALALYNLGTLMGNNALTSVIGNTPWFGLEDAIVILEQSVSANPNNENAKYNLELFKKLQSNAQTFHLTDYMYMLCWLESPVYFTGDVNKGY